MHATLSKKQLFYGLVFALLAQIIGISNATAQAGAISTPTPFKTTWIATGGSITIPTFSLSPSGTYNYTVNYRKKGTIPFTTVTGQTGNYTISGLTANDTIQVEITGTFPHFYMNRNDTEKTKLLSIDAWGNQNWKSMLSAFDGCTNLTYTATDKPDLSSVSSMEGMFFQCSKFNGDVSGWITDNITDMSMMFNGASTFNQNIASWNTSKVTNMGNMFERASAFNQNIGSWNTTNVTSMKSMFESAVKFNQPLTNWNTEKVINMNSMFSGATDFNQDLSVLELNDVGDVGNMLDNCGLSVANYDATLRGWATQTKTGLLLTANGLIYCASEAARTTLTTATASGGKGWTILGDSKCPPTPFKTTWKVAGGNIIIPTNSGFYTYNYTVNYRKQGTTAYTTLSNQTGNCTIAGLTNDDIIEVEITGGFPHIIFLGSTSTDRTKLLSIDAWGNQNWKSMQNAFFGCSNLTYNATDNPDLSTVTDMSGMFVGCSAFNGNIGGWNTSNVSNMSDVFSSAASFNQNIGSWNVSNVVSMSSMFRQARRFNQPLTNWNTAKVTNMSGMFTGAIVFNQDLSVLEINAVTDMTFMLNASGLSVANYDATLTGWLSQNKTGLSLGATGLKYCAAEAARTTLTTATANGGKGWTITGDVKLCPVPTIVVTGTPTPFSACNGTSSAIQSFTVSGTDLTAGIVIGKLTGFQVSLTPGTTFENTLTLPQSGGTVPLTTIYVRMSRLATGSPSGNIAITSTGAITKNVVVSGTVNALPVLNPSTNSPVCSGQTLFLYAKGERESSTDTYTWTGVNNFTANTQNPAINNVSMNANGVYTVSAISSANCSATATVMVTVKETPTLVVSNFTNPTPENNPDGTISFTTNLPNASFSLSYGSTGSPKDVTVNSGAFILSGLVSGVYGNFAVTNDGCTGRNNTEVTLLSTPFTLVKSITTGNWESSTTWNVGRVPKAGDVVIIDAGHAVTINSNSTIKDMEVRGQLIYGAVGIVINLGL